MYNITINFENNKDFLANVKYERFLDLAVAKVEDISDYAEKLRTFPKPDTEYALRDMGFFGFADAPFKIISNKNIAFGATAITDTEFLSDVYSKLNGEFYIIPSSIHELLALPCEMFASVDDVREIKKLINEVNSTEVSPCEVLSDNLYKFDGKAVAIVD